MQFTPHCSHWAGGEICLCALEGALPRATQTTQGSTISLRLSWDEIPNVSQLLWLPPCWGHTGPLAGPSDSPAVCAQGHRKAGFPVGLLLTPPCSFIFYVTPSHPASLLMLLPSGHSPQWAGWTVGLSLGPHVDSCLSLPPCPPYRASSHPGHPTTVSELPRPHLTRLWSSLAQG